ncbi:class I SAM-dependent methyltransferase [Roseibium sp. SCPC15]|uniref:class I SAM-dependent methyltransferase n=1 Tax=Roseibium sp. SCP15 TaxID=3141376 RepID=UPI00333D58D2
MSGFSSQWLALREPLDLDARDKKVEEAFFDQLPGRRSRILDLGSGTGSTVAALSERLPEAVDWLLTDYDPVLLDAASHRWKNLSGSDVAVRRIDLSADLEQLPFQEIDAVTTSAFLDLVSEKFLVRLINQIVKARKPFLASLTYDGRAQFSPAHLSDDDLLTALNTHQKTEKGFGTALGPDAAGRAVELFEQQGYRVVQGLSDWQVQPSSRDFLTEFLSGWVRVGQEVGLDPRALESWWQERAAQIREGQLHVVIGHIDFAAFPQ